VTQRRHAEFRQLALRVLVARAGSATEGEVLAAAVNRAYDDLARVCASLIGQVGVDALTARALYLAQQEYPWLVDVRAPNHARDPFVPVLGRLAGQDPAVAIEGAATVFAMLVGLLVTFIGKPLATSLIRRAWPETFSEAHMEET
jgi:hypothetical protein